MALRCVGRRSRAYGVVSYCLEMPYSTTLEGPYCRHHGGYVRVRDTTTRTVPGGYFWKWNHTTKSDARSTVFVLMLLSKFSGIHSVFEHPYTGKVSCPRLLETRVGVATMDGTVRIVVFVLLARLFKLLCVRWREQNTDGRTTVFYCNSITELLFRGRVFLEQKQKHRL